MAERGLLPAGRALTATFVAIPLTAAILTDFPLCPSASVLGWPCPGCGLTRATLALLGGDVSRALALHPLVVVALPGLVLLGTLAGLSLVQKFDRLTEVRVILEHWIMSRAGGVLGASFLFALLLVWGLRFAGWFGGPAPVETLNDWWRERATAEPTK